MYLDFIKNFFFISLFFISTSIVADDYRAGKHYQILAEPIATRDSEKIEVIEFFWFGCGHCYSLENQLNSWEKKLSSGVDFWRSPITWNEMAKTHAKLFYKIRRAETFGLKYEVRGVPAFVVNGKYKVSASRDVGTNELLDVVDYLINLERK